MSDLNNFIFSLRCTASLAALNEKFGMKHLKKKKKRKKINSTFLHGVIAGLNYEAVTQLIINFLR